MNYSTKILNHFDEKTLALATFEAIGIYSSFIIAAAIRFNTLNFSSPAIISGAGNIYFNALAFTVMNLVFMSFLGMYHSEHFKTKAGYVQTIYKLVINLFLVSMTPIFLFSAYATASINQEILAIACINISILLIAIRRVFFWMLHGSNVVPNILVIGNGRRAATLFTEDALGHQSSEYCIKGFVATTEGKEIVAENLTLHLGDSLLEQALALNIDEIVIALDDSRKESPTQHLLDCKLAGISVTDGASFLEKIRNQERNFGHSLSVDTQ